jgi:hypothetical protein
MSTKLTPDVLKKMILEEKEKISESTNELMGEEFLKKLILRERMVKRKLSLISRARQLLEAKLRRRNS